MRVYERLFTNLRTSGPKYSYCGKQTLEIDPSTIKAIGQMYTYGDFVTRWFVICDDDQLYFFKAVELSKEEQAWLRKARNLIKVPRMTRDVVQAMPVAEIRWMQK